MGVGWMVELKMNRKKKEKMDSNGVLTPPNPPLDPPLVAILTCPLVTDAKTGKVSQKCFHLVTSLVHLVFKLAQVGDDLAAKLDFHADQMWRSTSLEVHSVVCWRTTDDL